jgi:hypothetical protein
MDPSIPRMGNKGIALAHKALASQKSSHNKYFLPGHNTYMGKEIQVGVQVPRIALLTNRGEVGVRLPLLFPLSPESETTGPVSEILHRAHGPYQDHPKKKQVLTKPHLRKEDLEPKALNFFLIISYLQSLFMNLFKK